MITTFYPPYHFGGDAVFVRSLARALVAEGHEVEVVHCENAYRLKGQLPTADGENRKIRVHRLRSRFGPLSPFITQQTGRPGLKATQLRSILNRRFDVVNFHNISLIGGPAVLQMGTAAVKLYTLHEHWLLCPTHVFWKNGRQACDEPQCLQCCIRSGVPPQIWRYTGAVERGLRHVDALLSPSMFTAGRHRAAGLNVPIHVLPSFAVLDGATQKSVAPHERPTFLFVGRVAASKGIVDLVEEFSQLPEYDLVVIGEGELRAALQAKYARLSNVKFLGAIPHDDLARYYAGATALVLPSLAPEVFPLSVIEAFACGTPAIVRNAGGSREAVDRTGGGIVYESRDQLRQALRRLTDEATRRDLGRRARDGCERCYSQTQYVERYLELIGAIASEKMGSAKVLTSTS